MLYPYPYCFYWLLPPKSLPLGEFFAYNTAGQQTSLTALKDHDRQRHQRLLFAVDIPLGADGKPTGTDALEIISHHAHHLQQSLWLYYTKIGIGTPSQDHYVHVDTGSDILWVHLKLYDPSSSTTGQLIYCDQSFCLANKNGPDPGCTFGVRCGYYLQYGDGSSTAGYFVRDSIQYDRVSGNLATTTSNSSVIFGCGLRQTGNLDEPSTTLDGILGFGQSNRTKGGGIFAMGNVVQPKVNTTPVTPATTVPLPTPNLDSAAMSPFAEAAASSPPAVFDT
ncbi:hypothetical protein IFM89_012072 [Coptis chinensis]|uniref:Peptidase A1 domain-containing protein n=1 Tax=Coptis chinensis TaxID=261450 RepID=A0A835LZK1_9MAGN|nr:hypothetical protein IFM89_012072 [Coptis chinensis]